jgi:predicted nucleic acid-binding protein
MGKGYLIDTNVVIDFCNGKLPLEGRNFLAKVEPEISIITNIELLASKNISNQEYSLLEKFIPISNIYPVGIDLVATSIDIRQNYKLKLADAIIAATAYVHNLTLVTRNIKDFNNIKEIKLINPWINHTIN